MLCRLLLSILFAALAPITTRAATAVHSDRIDHGNWTLEWNDGLEINTMTVNVFSPDKDRHELCAEVIHSHPKPYVPMRLSDTVTPGRLVGCDPAKMKMPFFWGFTKSTSNTETWSASGTKQGSGRIYLYFIKPNDIGGDENKWEITLKDGGTRMQLCLWWFRFLPDCRVMVRTQP